MNVTLPSILTGSQFQRSSQFGESAVGRVRNATIIVREFMKAGYPFGVALAAVVNARHESDLSNAAIGDSGQSVGLFQLYSGGAGAGMSVEQRMDPYLNTRKIIEETKQYGSNLMAAYRGGASLADLSLIFGRDIERPANKGVDRDNTARALFPGLADLPAKRITLIGAMIPFIVAGALGLGGLILLSVSLGRG